MQMAKIGKKFHRKRKKQALEFAESFRRIKKKVKKKTKKEKGKKMKIESRNQNLLNKSANQKCMLQQNNPDAISQSPHREGGTMGTRTLHTTMQVQFMPAYARLTYQGI